MMTIKLMNWLNTLIILFILNGLIFLGIFLGLFIFGYFPTINSIRSLVIDRQLFQNQYTYKQIIILFFKSYLSTLRHQGLTTCLFGVIFTILLLDLRFFILYSPSILTIPLVVMSILFILNSFIFSCIEKKTTSIFSKFKFSLLVPFLYLRPLLFVSFTYIITIFLALLFPICSFVMFSSMIIIQLKYLDSFLNEKELI